MTCCGRFNHQIPCQTNRKYTLDINKYGLYSFSDHKERKSIQINLNLGSINKNI